MRVNREFRRLVSRLKQKFRNGEVTVEHLRHFLHRPRSERDADSDPGYHLTRRLDLEKGNHD